jgi:hypothetical protein
LEEDPGKSLSLRKMMLDPRWGKNKYGVFIIDEN